MISVITISRQRGSLGSEVGKIVAEKLGYRLVWRELINQAALRAGAPEAALAAIDDLGLLGISPSAQQQENYLLAVRQVVDELAKEGRVVIVGRAGQVILKDHPLTLHVRVIAPLDVRLARIVAERNISHKAALAQIEASDRARKSYLSRFYQINWEDPDLYDLIINTARLDCQAAAEVICQAVNRASIIL